MTPLRIIAVATFALAAIPAFSRTITDDPGGRVLERLESMLHDWDEQIRVTGRCASACTMHLGMPNVCTTASALWIFHGPSHPSVVGVMAAMYPEPIKTLFLTDWQFREVVIRGSELIRVGAAAKC